MQVSLSETSGSSTPQENFDSDGSDSYVPKSTLTDVLSKASAKSEKCKDLKKKITNNEDAMAKKLKEMEDYFKRQLQEKDL